MHSEQSVFVSHWRHHLPHGQDFGELNALATQSHGCQVTLDDPRKELKTVIVILQLCRAVNGEPLLLLLPRKRLGAATAFQLGMKLIVCQESPLSLGEFRLHLPYVDCQTRLQNRSLRDGPGQDVDLLMLWLHEILSFGLWSFNPPHGADSLTSLWHVPANNARSSRQEVRTFPRSESDAIPDLITALLGTALSPPCQRR